MVKPIDLTKFKKQLTKNIPGISNGFHDPVTWIDTGSYLMNYFVSGDFFKGFPLEGKVSMLAGESGSGKSYVAAGRAIKDAQNQGIYVILIDTENALDEPWLRKFDIDTSEEKMTKFNGSIVDEVGKLIEDFITAYKEQNIDIPIEEQPKVLFVIDSLGMMIINNDLKQLDDGDIKGDKGLKAKKLATLIKILISEISGTNIGMIMTNHVYDSQDMYSPDAKITGGNMVMFAPSIVVAMNQLKLKVDENGVKTTTVQGIRSKICARKTRYSKPFVIGEVDIPYETGIEPYSGIFDFMIEKGVITKVGNQFQYISPEDGIEIKGFTKKFTNDILLKIMKEYHHFAKSVKVEDTVYNEPDIDAELKDDGE